MRAIWNGSVLAESKNAILVEGNLYFPPESLNHEYLRKSEAHTVCGWKGVASYYDVEVDGKTNPNAAWYYPEALPAAEQIKGHVAFWNGVTVESREPTDSVTTCDSGVCTL